MLSSFIHILVCCRISFFFLRPNNISFCVYMYSFVCWTLGLLRVFAVVNNAAMSKCIQISLGDPVFYSFECIIISIRSPEFLDHTLNSVFHFLRNYYIVPCTTSRHRQQWARAAFSAHPHLCSFSVYFLIIAMLLSVRGYLIVVSICVFLTINDVERLFMCLISHLYIFFGEMSFQILFPLLNYCCCRCCFVPEACVCLWSEAAIRAQIPDTWRIGSSFPPLASHKPSRSCARNRSTAACHTAGSGG